jgi:hypothetical protein
MPALSGGAPRVTEYRATHTNAGCGSSAMSLLLATYFYNKDLS